MGSHASGPTAVWSVVAAETGASIDQDAPVFVISVAAELAGMHPQTLRQYDRLGLVVPTRTSGRGRRYCARDIARLREIQRLSQEDGVNLAGIQRILALEDEVAQLRARAGELQAGLRAAETGRRVFAAGVTGDIVAVQRGRRPERSRGALMVWRPPSP